MGVLCGFREGLVTRYREGGRAWGDGGVGGVVVKGGLRDSTGRGAGSQLRMVRYYCKRLRYDDSMEPGTPAWEAAY